MVLAPTVGRAQPAAGGAPASGAAIEQARERFKRGAEAYQAGRYQEAIDLFLQADRLASSPAFAFNVGVAYEDMGDAAHALRWLRVYLRRAPDASDRAEVAQHIARLEAAVQAKGLQQVTVESTPEAAELLVDGRSVGVTPWTGELAPGTHTVAARLRGFQNAESSFTLPPDHATDVALTLVALPQAPPPAVAAVPTAAPPGRSGVRARTWITLAVGAGSLGGALGFELARAAAEDDARTQRTQVDAADAAATMEERRTVARVLLGVGGAATVLGGVFLALDLSSGSPAPARAARAHLGCHGAGCMVGVDGAF
jgi:tetratricopeptide (TPR) repeat protein